MHPADHHRVDGPRTTEEGKTMTRDKRRARNHERRQAQKAAGRNMAVMECAHCGHSMMSAAGRMMHEHNHCDNCGCTDHDH